jgi:hypothetical protein
MSQSAGFDHGLFSLVSPLHEAVGKKTLRFLCEVTQRENISRQTMHLDKLNVRI